MALLCPHNSLSSFPVGHGLAPSFSRARLEIDSLQQGFIQEALNASSLLGMMGAGLAFRMGRAFSLGITSSWASSPLKSNLLRLSSNLFGFGGEVLAFEGITRSSRVLLEGADSSILRWEGNQGFATGLIQGALTLGSLKLSGHAFQTRHVFLQHFVQDSAMVASHQAAEYLHLVQNSDQSLIQKYFHAEASLFQMNLGMSLAHRALPCLSSIERSLDFNSNVLGISRFQTPLRTNAARIPSMLAEGKNEIVRVEASSDFEVSGWVTPEDVTQAPELARVTLCPKSGIFPSEPVSVAQSDWAGLFLRRASGEIVKVNYNIDEPGIFQPGDSIYLQKQRYNEAGINFRAFYQSVSLKCRNSILRSEISYWRSTRDPLVFENFDSLGNSEGVLRNPTDRGYIELIHKFCVELCTPTELLEILLSPDATEVLRQQILANPPRVPEAVVAIQAYLRNVNEGRLESALGHPDMALQGLYKLTCSRNAGEEALFTPREYWELISREVREPVSRLFPDLIAEDFGERLDLYEQHLIEAVKLVGREALHAEVRHHALTAMLGSSGELFKKRNDNAQLRLIRQRALLEVLRIEERNPTVVWYGLHDNYLIQVLIDQGFATREQILGRMVRVFEKWNGQVAEHDGGSLGYVQTGTMKTWLKQAEIALEGGECPYGDWYPTEGGQVQGLISFGETPTTFLGRFFVSFFAQHVSERNTFARLVAKYGEVSAANVDKILVAAHLAHESGESPQGHAYFALLGGVRDARAAVALYEELESTTSFFGIRLTEGNVEGSQVRTTLKAKPDQDYHCRQRLVTVLTALHAQGAVLAPEIIRKILVGFARYYAQQSKSWMGINDILFPLYDLDPVTAITAFHEIDGSPLSLLPNQKLSHRLEGILASLTWFAVRERENDSERRVQAKRNWQKFFEVRFTTPDELRRMAIEHHMSSWGQVNENLMDYLKRVNQSDLASWREYLEHHPERMLDLERYASGDTSVEGTVASSSDTSLVLAKPASVTQRLARRILELLDAHS